MTRFDAWLIGLLFLLIALYAELAAP